MSLSQMARLSDRAVMSLASDHGRNHKEGQSHILELMITVKCLWLYSYSMSAAKSLSEHHPSESAIGDTRTLPIFL